MINSKLRAYRYDNGTWHVVTRWDLLKLSKVDYENYKSKYFEFLYSAKSLESFRLTFNTAQKTFRYLPNQVNNENKTTKGMTISHVLAQEVLSEMETLKFSLVDKRKKPYRLREFEIKVDQTLIEKRVLDGKYIVDLMVFFSSPPELALKWNRCFAMEIMVTNEVDGNKMTDFENARIPLIEVELTEKLIIKKSAMETTEEEENNNRNYIANAFKKGIRGDIFVDCSSDKYLESEAVISLQNKVEELSLNLSKSNQAIEAETQEKDKLDKKVAELDRVLQEYRHLNSKLNIEIAMEKDKTTIVTNKLRDFRKKPLFSKVIDHFSAKGEES